MSEKNLGYDITSLDLASGELRLIEVKGLGAATGTISADAQRAPRRRGPARLLLALRRHRLRHCTPTLQEPIRDPARFPWHEVSKVQHYWLEISAMTSPMQVRENGSGYGEDG